MGRLRHPDGKACTVLKWEFGHQDFVAWLARYGPRRRCYGRMRPIAAIASPGRIERETVHAKSEAGRYDH